MGAEDAGKIGGCSWEGWSAFPRRTEMTVSRMLNMWKMDKKPQRIPRNKNANGTPIVLKLIQCEVVDAFDLARDDLNMLIFQYAETEEDFRNNKLLARQHRLLDDVDGA